MEITTYSTIFSIVTCASAVLIAACAVVHVMRKRGVERLAGVKFKMRWPVSFGFALLITALSGQDAIMGEIRSKELLTGVLVLYNMRGDEIVHNGKQVCLWVIVAICVMGIILPFWHQISKLRHIISRKR